MITLRKYQQEAVQSVFNYFQENDGHPLIVLPTGTGKSLVIADICRLALKYPGTRIVVATHVKELVQQNYDELHTIWPEAPAGIYSAGLNKRDTQSQILFCGIQSIYNKAFKIQRCDLLIVDEAHRIPKKSEGMWDRLIKDLTVINRDMKVIGLTATPFRMDSGLLVGGLFTDICYEYSILDALNERYLAEVIPLRTETQYDVSGVHKRGGEFIAEELEAAINIDDKTDSAINEIIKHGEHRKSWLIFAAGNKHAYAIHARLKALGYIGGIVTQETSKTERARAVACIKNGEYRYLVNNLVFTTGFNAKNIDLIACFRFTMSTGLWVQILGRGMRLWASKANCLVLDFGRNADRHGPLDQICGIAKKETTGDGQAPVKTCDQCYCVCFAAVRECPDCGAPFPEPELKIDDQASDAPMISTQMVPIEHMVISMRTARHTKPGKPDSMIVKYNTYGGSFSEWICFNHTGYAKEKAHKWHRQRLPYMPTPCNVDEALTFDYPTPEKIIVKQNGKYMEIIKS